MSMVLSSRQSHCKSSSGSFDECRTAPSGRRPKTKPDDLGCESACTSCQNLHPPSPFIIITQPESWYSFYRPTEGRRLSRPSWLLAGYIPRWFTRPQTVTDPGTNRVWRSATTLIEANALPLCQTAKYIAAVTSNMIVIISRYRLNRINLVVACRAPTALYDFTDRFWMSDDTCTSSTEQSLPVDQVDELFMGAVW